MHDDEDHFDMGGIQAMGIISALRTGDPTFDLLIAMCLPFAIRFLFSLVERILSMNLKFTFKNTKLHHRTITYKYTRNSYGDVYSDQDTQNSVLLKAIRLYLNQVVKIKLHDADLDLTSTLDKAGDQQYHDDYESDDENDQENTVAGALSKLKIVNNPPKGSWYKIGQFGQPAVELEICIQNQENREDKDKESRQPATTETVLSFSIRAKHGEAIDDFIDKAYKWYIAELRKSEDNSRYLYELKKGDDDKTNQVFTRYKLSDEKTFDSLFFRQKDSLLTMIDHFMNKTGRYAIKGYPHKLGLLLHGPPGTGKTSLLKALAQYTGRSIINIPLARITTNAELMSIFYNDKRSIDSEYCPVKLGFKDAIFVMEDVDAASKVVKRRDGLKPCDIEKNRKPEPKPAKSVFSMLLESKNEECKECVKKLLEKSERLRCEAKNSPVMKDLTERLNNLSFLAANGGCNKEGISFASEAARAWTDEQESFQDVLESYAGTLLHLLEGDVEIDQDLENTLLGIRDCGSIVPSGSTSTVMSDDTSLGEMSFDLAQPSGPEPSQSNKLAKFLTESAKKDGSETPALGAAFSWLSKPPKDALNLTGLLNVLDGVVDSPGRIVVMTTNHVEHLDPALIRPGRIDKKLLLGYMAANDVISMLEHYYQTTLDDNEQTRIRKVMGSSPGCIRMTPAECEQLTAEYEDVEDMILKLEDMALHS